MLPSLGPVDPVCLCRWHSNCHLKKVALTVPLLPALSRSPTLTRSCHVLAEGHGTTACQLRTRPYRATFLPPAFPLSAYPASTPRESPSHPPSLSPRFVSTPIFCFLFLFVLFVLFVYIINKTLFLSIRTEDFLFFANWFSDEKELITRNKILPKNSEEKILISNY